MCLAIPGKVLEEFEQRGMRMAKVQFGGIVREASLDYVPRCLARLSTKAAIVRPTTSRTTSAPSMEPRSAWLKWVAGARSSTVTSPSAAGCAVLADAPTWVVSASAVLCRDSRTCSCRLWMSPRARASRQRPLRCMASSFGHCVQLRTARSTESLSGVVAAAN